MKVWASGIAAALLGGASLLAPQASACTIDALPSAVVSGRVAVLSQLDPASIDPSTYAPFTIPGSFGVGWPMRFTEHAGHLALTPSELHQRWWWQFGDGSAAWGHTPTHTYQHPGTYIVTVATDVRSPTQLLPFDRVAVRLLAPAQLLRIEGDNLLNGSRADMMADPQGGLYPLQAALTNGQVSTAQQVWEQTEVGAWASLKDYWQHKQRALPTVYARVDILLRQEGAALRAGDVATALHLVNDLLRIWSGVSTSS